MKIDINKEINSFNKGGQIAREVVELLREEKSSKHEVLDEYIANNPTAAELFETITNATTVSQILSEYKREEKIKGEISLKKRLRKIESKRRIRIALYSGISAACAMIAISFLLETASEEKIESAIAFNHEISTPTLILNNGDTINLENNKERVANKNYGLKKLDENKIANNENLAAVETYNKIIIPSKYTYSIVLNDGSEVFLNANSEFKYPETFMGDKREVFLKGEGHFKVKKSDKPFIVTTTDISVKVYGTTFNINTNLSGTVETVLVSGSVGVTVNSIDSQEVIIKPNEMFTLNKSSGKVDVRNVSVDDYVSWVDGYFSCTRMPMKLFIDQLAAWYGVKFSFNKDSLSEIPVSVLRLHRNLELENILKIVENMAEVEIIKKTGGDYLIQ